MRGGCIDGGTLSVIDYPVQICNYLHYTLSRNFMRISISHIRPLDENLSNFYLGSYTSTSSQGTSLSLCCTHIFNNLMSTIDSIERIVEDSVLSSTSSSSRSPAISLQRAYAVGILMAIFIYILSVPDPPNGSVSQQNAKARENASKVIAPMLYEDSNRHEKVQQILFVAFRTLEIVLSEDKGEGIHSFSLLLSYLGEDAGLLGINITFSTFSTILEMVSVEFHPRFLLLFSWMVGRFLSHLSSPAGMVLAKKCLSCVHEMKTRLHGILECGVESRDGLKKVGMDVISPILVNFESEAKQIVESISSSPFATRYECDVEGMRQLKGFAVKSCGDVETLLESLSQTLVATHVHFSLQEQFKMYPPAALNTKTSHRVRSELHSAIGGEMVMVARAPARIDLAGGWSDTPPCSYEVAGAVLNVAVLVDGRYPIHCIARYTTVENPVSSIFLRSMQEIRSPEKEVQLNTFENCEINKLSDFEDFSDPSAPCGLIKAVLVALGVQKFLKDQIISNYGIECVEYASSSVPFTWALNSAFGGGLEIIAISALPAGSGMGGSSVLAATIVR